MPSGSSTPCANPLYAEWILELYDRAKEHNTKGVFTYKKAYDAIRKHPTPIHDPAQAAKLEGIGEKTCQYLAQKLEKHCKANDLPLPEALANRGRRAATEEAEAAREDAPRPAKRARKEKAYVPALRTGPYAILLALSTVPEDSLESLTKEEIVGIGQPYCGSSFTVPSHANKRFTAWNSMKTLLSKELVQERGRPVRRYTLTDGGWEIARKIRQALPADEQPSGAAAMDPNDVPRADSHGDSDDPMQPTRNILQPISGNSAPNTSNESQSNAQHHEPDLTAYVDSPAFDSDLITCPPGSFTIHPILDNRELMSKSNRAHIADELSSKGCHPIKKALPLGDILWIARINDPTLSTRITGNASVPAEIVLDFIVERKRLDDLLSSIFDGRFLEQKFRLKRSGLRHIIYLIEDSYIGPADEVARHHERIMSAIASTQVVDGIFVKRTRELKQSIEYLVRLTNLLRKQYEPQPLHILPSCLFTSSTSTSIKSIRTHLRTHPSHATRHYGTRFTDFASASSKTGAASTLRDVYLKMLMCTRGVSADKALAIQKVWPTPATLVRAYRERGEASADTNTKDSKVENMVEEKLSNVVGPGKIGKAVSVKVAQVWGRPYTKDDLDNLLS